MLTSSAATDQATGLRRLVAPTPVRVVAVTGGKGGVGKTNVSVNLAVALAELERRVMLLDADLGLANVDVVLGLHPPFDLSHVIRGERELQEIVMQGPGGIQVVPGASGVKEMASLSETAHAGLIQAFSDLGTHLDTLVVDTAAGISDTVISFARAAHEVLVVVCDEPASLTDAYAIIKLLSRDHGQARFRILANMVQSSQEGHELYNKLCRVTDRYLDVMLGYMGGIPHDEALRKAVRSQRAVVQAYPRSRVAQAFRSLARKIDALPMPTGANGQLQFFVERLIQYSTEFGEIGR
jgi:flagellar biosynthesis protein FlhG